MNTEIGLSNETIEKLRKLLGSFETFEHDMDMYSLCISKILKKEISENLV